MRLISVYRADAVKAQYERACHLYRRVAQGISRRQFSIGSCIEDIDFSSLCFTKEGISSCS
jgi:hypothetical protein